MDIFFEKSVSVFFVFNKEPSSSLRTRELIFFLSQVFEQVFRPEAHLKASYTPYLWPMYESLKKVCVFQQDSKESPPNCHCFSAIYTRAFPSTEYYKITFDLTCDTSRTIKQVLAPGLDLLSSPIISTMSSFPSSFSSSTVVLNRLLVWDLPASSINVTILLVSKF